jgi:hypothetical protein
MHPPLGSLRAGKERTLSVSKTFVFETNNEVGIDKPVEIRKSYEASNKADRVIKSGLANNSSAVVCPL